MTQAERDRLVSLKKAKKRLITQRQAAEELGLSVRQVKRLLQELKKRGDKAVVHGLRGKPSARKIAGEIRGRAVEMLSGAEYRDFGPTLAAEYLWEKQGIAVSRETVRQWMIEAGLWKGRRQKLEEVHLWRPRRSRCGELVQWDTSDHDWLEGRGEGMYLIAMIDDATSRLHGRFVAHDSTQENMRVLEGYLRRYGRPRAFYTDKASLFQTASKRRRDEPGVDKDGVEMPPTQIGRALRELEIAWIAAHSPQAKGRVERGFSTAQDRLVKGMRVAGVRNLEEANVYLEMQFLPWWNRTLTVQAAHGDDAHRRLEKRHDLAAILSHVEQRQVKSNYTIQFDGEVYQIERESICPGLRGAQVRVERRQDGSLAVRFRDRYLRTVVCAPRVRQATAAKPAIAAKKRKAGDGQSRWMEGFFQRPAPPLWQAIKPLKANAQ